MVNKYFAEVEATVSSMGVVYEATVYRRRFDSLDRVVDTREVGSRRGTSFDDLTDDISMFLSTMNATADQETIEYP